MVAFSRCSSELTLMYTATVSAVPCVPWPFVLGILSSLHDLARIYLEGLGEFADRARVRLSYAAGFEFKNRGRAQTSLLCKLPLGEQVLVANSSQLLPADARHDVQHCSYTPFFSPHYRSLSIAEIYR